jgi:hypothetical protein
MNMLRWSSWALVALLLAAGGLQWPDLRHADADIGAGHV